MGWKKNRKKGELAFEGGFFDIPILGDFVNVLASAGSDILGVTGEAGSDVVNVLQKPVTGTDLEDIAITENVSVDDLAKLATEVLATGGTSLVKNAPKAASLVDDIVKNVGNKTVTVPVPTGVGSVSGGAKVKIKDIAEAAVEGAKKTGKVVKEQIAPLSLGGKEGSITRKLINTAIRPISGKSGTLLSKFDYPKFPYFQRSKGTMADYLLTGAANIPSAVGNFPTAFLQSRFGTIPTGYSLYRGLTDEPTLNPDDYYAWTNTLQNAGLGILDYYTKYSTEEDKGSPVADYVTYPTLNLYNNLTRKKDSPRAKEIEKQVTENYLGSGNTLPPVNLDSLRTAAQGNLKFNPEQIEKLNRINEINKDIKEQVDSIKSPISI
jgi:hypothetical protein